MPFKTQSSPPGPERTRLDSISMSGFCQLICFLPAKPSFHYLSVERQADSGLQGLDTATQWLYAKACADNYQEDDKSRVELQDKVVKRPFRIVRNYSKQPESSDFRTVFVSGFCSSTTLVGECGGVIIIASGFGIMAKLPLLQEPIQGFNRAKVRTRDIHLMWQLQNTGSAAYCSFSTDICCEEYPANELLDGALNDDTLDHGYT